MIAPIRERMDAVMALPDDPEKPLWWWCDALFMAPPVLTKLSRATGDRKYLDFMDHEWWITSGLLYSPSNHLFFRDKSFLDKHEANGSSIFWSRGNGWVFAALARVLAEMPQDYPSRAEVCGPIQRDGRGTRRRCRVRTGFGGLGCWMRRPIRCRRTPDPLFLLMALPTGSTPASWIARNTNPWCRKPGRAAVSHLRGWQAGLHPADRSRSRRLHCCLELCFRYRRFSARGLGGLPPGTLNLLSGRLRLAYHHAVPQEN